MPEINWYPGHMAKTRRLLAEQLKAVDAVVELCDARAPQATRNPDLNYLCRGKTRILILNKADLADDAVTSQWLAHYRDMGLNPIRFNSTGTRTRDVLSAIEAACAPAVERMRARGVNKTARLMVIGIPNVGKSTFINKVAHRKTARAEDRPGVTRTKQWVPVDQTLELLDTPGILWPKFDDKNVGLRLAFTGAIKDDVMDIEELACALMAYLAAHYADIVTQRYKITIEDGDSGYDLLIKAGRKRGFLMRGAEVDTERMARILLDEFRGGKLGTFTLETVEDAQ